MTVAFKEAVEAKNWEQAIECLAPDVKFNSPVAFKPFEGKEAVSGVLRAVSQTFEDFRYTDELTNGDTHILVFRARVADKELEGIDLLRMNDEGQIEDFTVMVRPASGLMALGEAMGPKVASLKS
jgi:hypothetical protein